LRRSLFDSIKELVAGQPAPEPTTAEQYGVDPLHLAACALLLDVAYADGEFSAPEIKHVEDTLARHFGLSPEDAQRLLDIAEDERRRSVDHYQFTSLLQRHYDLGQKMVLAEVIWGLVLADGEIAEHEHYLTRKISNLLDLQPAYLATAKAAAARAAGAGE
jgi:uncharacterized tellurite resistance protein B-like protein